VASRGRRAEPRRSDHHRRHDAVQKELCIYSGEPAYELRDVWIRVDNEFYIVSIGTEWTNPEDFDAFESMADDLLESLVIK